MGQHHLNEKVKLFIGAILSAAKETVPKKEDRLHPRLECTAARTPQYCQQTKREDGILPDR